MGRLGYTRLLVDLLNSDWAGAIGNGNIIYHAQPQTVVYGVIGGLAVALFTIWLTVRKLAQAQAITLIQVPRRLPTPPMPVARHCSRPRCAP